MQPVWEFKVSGNTFKAYSEADNTALERAYNAQFDSARNRVEIMGGEYFINVNQLLQYKSDDLMKQRLVRRRMAPKTTTTTTAAAPVSAKSTPAVDSSTSGQKRQRIDECVKTDDDEVLEVTPSASTAGRKGVSAADTTSSSSGRKEVPAPSSASSNTMFSRPGANTTSTTEGATSKVITMERFANTVMHLYCPPPAAKGSGASPTEQYKLAGSDKTINTSTPRAVLEIISRALANVPAINKTSLSTCAKVGRPHTREWLKTLGKMSKPGSVFLHLSKPINTLPPSLQVGLSPKFTTTVGEMVQQRDAARFTIVGPPPVRKSNAQSASVLVTCLNAATPEPLSDEEHLQAQLMMISGPITMLYNNDYSPVMRPPEIICCSIPGINFEYSGVDRRAWLKPTNPNAPNGDMDINTIATLERMRVIWAHTLASMDVVHKVRIACLCAIGCGAFKGNYGDAIPELWGRALALAVTKTKLCGSTGTIVPAPVTVNGTCVDKGVFEVLQTVAVSIPTFGADNNITPFNKGLSTGLAAIKGSVSGKNATLANHPGAISYPPVLLVEDASMTTMATYFKVFEKAQAGILNPSDVQAIRHGWVGMYWDGGHVALEELLATCTTLLLHHVGVCRELYEDVNRRIFFEL